MVLGFQEPLYFRSSHPLSFPQGEGVWERFFLNLTMPARGPKTLSAALRYATHPIVSSSDTMC